MPGEKWHETIQAALDRAKVAVLLVSSKFLASDYITSNELPTMLAAAETEGMTIFWIPVQHSPYEQSPIARFQAAHTPDKPLSSLSRPKRAEAFVNIGRNLARVLGVQAT
jgi:internalin A